MTTLKGELDWIGNVNTLASRELLGGSTGVTLNVTVTEYNQCKWMTLSKNMNILELTRTQIVLFLYNYCIIIV